MLHEKYMVFSELIAQGSFEIVGAQRLAADEMNNETTERFNSSALARECAEILERHPEAYRCWKLGDGYILGNRGGWIVGSVK